MFIFSISFLLGDIYSQTLSIIWLLPTIFLLIRFISPPQIPPHPFKFLPRLSLHLDLHPLLTHVVSASSEEDTPILISGKIASLPIKDHQSTQFTFQLNDSHQLIHLSSRNSQN